jgi:NAD(P)-dependent dehydrogenase (short-subunit alcohol dehydrogenase family)
VLVGRDNARLRSARDRIAAAIPDADLALERADLARLDEVRQLADRLVEAPPPGVVISNAALIAPLDRRTPDGLSQVLTVNHLAPYLLMRVLAGAARAASPVCRRRRRTRLARACAGRPRRPHVRPPRASRRTGGVAAG